MDIETRLKYLRYALIIIGVIFVLGIYPMMNYIWPDGWRWEPHQAEYEQMIVGIYATLGVFLFMASRDPMAHKSLIWFTIWVSIVRAGIMVGQAVFDSGDRIHLAGDIPALLLVAIVLGLLMPRGKADIPRTT